MARVLVVEDDPAILETVAYNLEREGHEVVKAADGVAALQLSREVEPDLIVLDLMLPRMSGLDVCRVVREERPVPILMLTARDTEPTRSPGWTSEPMTTSRSRSRCASWWPALALPCAAMSCRARLVAVRRAATSCAAAVSSCVPPPTRSLATASPSPLRPKEFDLLEYLMRHPGQVLQRDTILERVWGYEFGGGTRTVDVHIRWLREKLEADPSHPQHLQTVRGVGYKFVP